MAILRRNAETVEVVELDEALIAITETGQATGCLVGREPGMSR